MLSLYTANFPRLSKSTWLPILSNSDRFIHHCIYQYQINPQKWSGIENTTQSSTMDKGGNKATRPLAH